MENTQTLIATSTIEIKASAAKVWEAFTSPEMVKQYLFGTTVETDWKVGSPIKYTGTWEGKQYEDKGMILENIPERKLVSTYWSSMSSLPDSPENYKKVSYILEPNSAGDMTKVTITQDNNKNEEEAKHSEQNWNMVLGKMKMMLEE